MTEREQQILALLRQDPLIPQQELADQLGISRSAVAGHIMNLAQKGHIRGKGYILAEQRYIAAVGGANMDIVGSAASTLRHGDSNPGQVRCSPGGVARNVAENLARLGADCRLVSVVGDDIHGRSLLEATQRAGVDVRGCLTLPDAATSTYLSIQQADGDMALAINDMDILKRLTPERLQAQRDLVRHAGAVVADTNLGADALAWLIAETGNKPLFVDPVSAFKAERIRPWLSRIHTLKPNRLEAATLSGLPLERAEHAPEAARWFHGQGVRRVVLSMAGAGIYFSGEAGDGWLDAPDCAIVNTTGSGDALMAGLAWGWLNELSLADSVRFARGCAALTLSCAATNNPSLSRAAVEAYLNA